MRVRVCYWISFARAPTGKRINMKMRRDVVDVGEYTVQLRIV